MNKQYYLNKKVELLDMALYSPYAVERTRALNACKVIDQILETIELDSSMAEQEKRLAELADLALKDEGFKDRKGAI